MTLFTDAKRKAMQSFLVLNLLNSGPC